MSKAIDLTGQRFGKLTVIEQAHISGKRNAMWLCRCDCGREILANGSNLRRGHKKSCGCLQKKPPEDDKVCEYCGEAVAANDRRFCSRACASRANGGHKRVEVDMSYEWRSVGGGLWACRYRRFVQCKDRNCAECGWNPEVAEARTRAIIEQRKAVSV